MDGVDPVWLGVMIGINLQTSFLTPPFGFSLFYLRGVAPRTVTTGHIYRGVIPFVVMQAVAMAILYMFPGMATELPKMIFSSPAAIVQEAPAGGSADDALDSLIPMNENGDDSLMPEGFGAQSSGDSLFGEPASTGGDSLTPENGDDVNNMFK
jgi:hypothetical protein